MRTRIYPPPSPDTPPPLARTDFEVTDALPGVSWTLPRSFAGSIPVDRAGHPNNTLFFWAFEKVGQNGSLTAPASADNSDPWIIWLQGG